MTFQLTLHLKREYFERIERGEQEFEFRPKTAYWHKHLINRKYKTIRLVCGYPKRGEKAREILVRYRGWLPKIVKHPNFGEKPVRVFAIFVHDRIN
jgi:hypothetical protein